MQVEDMLQEFARPVLDSLSELHISSGHNERKGATLTPLSSSVHVIQELKEAIVSYSFFSAPELCSLWIRGLAAF